MKKQATAVKVKPCDKKKTLISGFLFTPFTSHFFRPLLKHVQGQDTGRHKQEQ